MAALAVPFPILGDRLPSFLLSPSDLMFLTCYLRRDGFHPWSTACRTLACDSAFCFVVLLAFTPLGVETRYPPLVFLILTGIIIWFV